ncbi:MAG: alpha/beta hydrolase fold protein [Herminiimonas sp.]|nr:alpha/beta hydrolase fold protein [Herminiimonas sp.]MDB5854191.1 alpha/beta hydrolase fold protein [Herminiimonas sp.]
MMEKAGEDIGVDHESDGANAAQPVSSPALPQGAHEGFVQTSAGRVHYVAGGAGSPLFLIHGGHGAWPHWHANFVDLASRHTVIALDMPGFGESDAINDITHINHIALPVWEAIRVIRLAECSEQPEAPIDIAAFSFGTVVAATLASHHPAEIRRLLLINPPGLGPVSDEVKAIQARAANEARLHGVRAGIGMTLRDFMLCQPDRDSEAALDLLEYCVRKTRFVSRSLSRATHLMPILEALKMPVHVLLGQNDPHQRHALEERRATIENMHGKSVTVMPDAAHWLQYDRPLAFAELTARLFADNIAVEPAQ